MDTLTKILNTPGFTARVGRLFDMYWYMNADGNDLVEMSALSVLSHLFDEVPLPQYALNSDVGGPNVEVEGQTSLIEEIEEEE